MISYLKNAVRNNPVLNQSSLPLIARYTFRLHLIGWILGNVAFAGLVFPLSDIILKRAFNASDIQITIHAMMMPVASLFSIHWASIMAGRDKRVFFLIAAFFGRLILVLILLVSNANHYLLLIGILFFFNSLVMPAQNNIFQNNYPAHLRGRLFGSAMAAATLVTMPFVYFSGWLLEMNEDAYKILFVIGGVMGFLSVMILRRIRIRHRPIDEGETCEIPIYAGYAEHPRYLQLMMSVQRLTVKPVVEMIALFRKKRTFALFEGAFMVYGFGFLVILPAIPKWLDEVVHMPYDDISVARTVIPSVLMILLSATMGRLMEKSNPMKFCAYVNALMVLFPILIVTLPMTVIVFSQPVNVGVYTGFFIFGLGIVGINIAWNLSSIYFAGKDEVSLYMGAHVTLVGVRGLTAPLLGYLVMTYVSLHAVFWLSAFFFALSSAFMAWLHVSTRKKNERDMSHTAA